MVIQGILQNCPPESLVDAKNMAHKAVQLVTKSARANLDPVPDDNHSNLGWDDPRGAFMSQPLATGDEDVIVGLAVSSLTLLIVKGGRTIANLDLSNVTDVDASAWLDAQLVQAGLDPASQVSLPYDLPSGVDEIKTYSMSGLGQTLPTLGAWFALADSVLADFAAGQTGIRPGPSAVRCWPHHFDIATYVGLEVGGLETARGVGVGMSPGDENYGQPYFYINPWPRLEIDALPKLPPPGHWHTQGFVGAIATGDEVLSLSEIEMGLTDFVVETFSLGRRKLGV